MLLNIISSKKEENLKLLRDWVEDKIDTLDAHENMIELLLVRIDKKLKISL